MTTTICNICNIPYRNNNIKKHMARCDGTPSTRFIKRSHCKHCNLTFESLTRSERANHSRWCIKNPKRNEYRSVAKLKANYTQDVKQLISEKLKQAHHRGVYDKAKQNQRDNPSFLGKRHSEASKEAIRQAALRSKHRRLQRNIIEYIKTDGTLVCLDSTWEVTLAARLDELCILWIRPGPIQWSDHDGVQHNYFPDFYLPEYDLFLDPKNPQAVRVQRQKMNILDSVYPNIIWLYSLDECKTYSVP